MIAVPGLACPACRKELRTDGEATLSCDTCSVSYPVFDGIPSFVPLAPGGRPSPHQLSVLVSARNEGAPLDRVLAALRQELRSLAIDHELIVMDSGSTYGRALRRGLEQATGEYVLTLDADGSHDPSFLHPIWAARTDAEVVIASRYVEGGSADMPRARRALSRMLNRGLRRGLSLPYSDLSSGYRMYRRAAVEALPLEATGFDILQGS